MRLHSKPRYALHFIKYENIDSTADEIYLCRIKLNFENTNIAVVSLDQVKHDAKIMKM